MYQAVFTKETDLKQDIQIYNNLQAWFTMAACRVRLKKSSRAVCVSCGLEGPTAVGSWSSLPCLCKAGSGDRRVCTGRLVCTGSQETGIQGEGETGAPPKEQPWGFLVFLLCHSGSKPVCWYNSQPAWGFCLRQIPSATPRPCWSNLTGHFLLKLTQLVNCHR